ncbi:MAG: HAMP domain-containing histidine kinase, partial [Gammaproteobacteria bacterium]|nr:HAMP domain-containing histidine kinase [Gammaproteobacteria bacterium]
ESERAAQSAGTRFKEKTESGRAAQSAGTRFKKFSGSCLPTLYCHRQTDDAEQPQWRCELINWEGATPGVRRTGEIFAALLAGAAARLEKSLQFAEEEKQRMEQAHLAELGGLSAAAAHELRNPLNIIAMASASCEDGIRREIKAQLARADYLIKDLLTYAGNIQIHPCPLDVATQLQMLPGNYPECTIRTEIAPDLLVQADPVRFQQILRNLLDNASAMLRGHEDPRILIRAVRAEDGFAQFTVGDNGPGIPDDLLDTVFQPFTTRRSGGTGLGLAIARRLVEAHGGRISTVKRAGWGGWFEFFIPMP